MIHLLANVGEITRSDGSCTAIDPMRMQFIAFSLLLISISIPILVLLFYFYYAKKLQNQQILAAIEKGMPVHDLLATPKKNEAGWISNISAGIGLIVFAVATYLIVYFYAGIYEELKGELGTLMIFLAIPLVFACVGIARLLRGIFQKIAQGKATANQ